MKGVAAQSKEDVSLENCADLRNKLIMCAGMHVCMPRDHCALWCQQLQKDTKRHKCVLAQVLESWQLVLRGQPMDINVEDVRVYARDGAAFVTCTEVMEAGNSRGRCVPDRMLSTRTPHSCISEA